MTVSEDRQHLSGAGRASRRIAGAGAGRGGPAGRDAEAEQAVGGAVEFAVRAFPPRARKRARFMLWPQESVR